MDPLVSQPEHLSPLASESIGPSCPENELSLKELWQFEEHGYVQIPNIFTPEEVARLQSGVDVLREKASSLGGMDTLVSGSEYKFFKEVDSERCSLKRVTWCGSQDAIFNEISRDPRIIKKVGQLLEAEHFLQLVNQVHIKDPGSGVKSVFHRDVENRGLREGLFDPKPDAVNYVNVFIAIDESREDNGPLRVVPRSQKGNFLHTLKNDCKSTQYKFKDSEIVPIILKPGDIAILHPLTIHGSEVNSSEFGRSALISGFSVEGISKKEYTGAGKGFPLSLI